MKKLICLISATSLFFFSSCSKDDDPKIIGEQDLHGYWKLDRVLEDGDEIDFDDYVSNLEDFYYYFDEDGRFHTVTDYGASALVGFSGDWELEESELSIELDQGSNDDIDIISFSANEITLEDGDYQLIFERIDEEDFLWSDVSATVDGNEYVSLVTQGYHETNEVVFYAESGNGYTLAVFVDPRVVDEGDDIDLTDGDVAAVGYYNDTDFFFSVSGELHVERLDSDLFEGTFDDVVADEISVLENVEITNGRFKVTLNN